jgi:hypothetical protein
MASMQEKKRQVLLRRLQRVDRKIAHLKKVLDRLQNHLSKVTKEKAA